MKRQLRDLQGHVSIVTGAAQGIGKAIVAELLSRGSYVTAVDLQGVKLRHSMESIDISPDQWMALETDVTNTSQVRVMVADCIERFGKVNILVNNAGGSGDTGIDHIEHVTDEILEQVINVNFKSVFLCSREVASAMKEKHYGRIVNLSSISAKGTFGHRGPSAARLPYAGAKAGVVGFTNQLAKDLGPFGITVNAVMPGFILTEPSARVSQRFAALSDEEKDQIVGSIPIGRAGSAHEVASVVGFLCSQEASYISGATIEVTGGL